MTPSLFAELVTKEIDRARRYGRVFSVLLFSIDHLPQLRLRLGPGPAGSAVEGVSRVLSAIVRDADLLAPPAEDQPSWSVMLPETDRLGAQLFARRVSMAARDEPQLVALERQLPLGLMGGVASYPEDGADFTTLVERCRQRMEAQRASLHRTLALEPLGFWEEVELLAGGPDSPPLPQHDSAPPALRGKLPSGLFEQVEEEIVFELLRHPGARGVLYAGASDPLARAPLTRALEEAPPHLRGRIYLLGRRADVRDHPALSPVFLDGEERLDRYAFLLWLGERSAYALVQRRGAEAGGWGFHSSDPALVDGLIAKLQTEYGLQAY